MAIHTLPRFIAEFGELAVAAQSEGLRVALEPMPMNNLGTLEVGAEVVEAVGNAAAGLCVDVTHVFRGGTEYRSLSRLLPIDRVFIVELADSIIDLGGKDPWDDAINHRLYPGMGELQVASFVVEMVTAGWDGPWGVEISSQDHRSASLRESLVAAYEASDAVLDAAESTLSQLSSNSPRSSKENTDT